MVDGDRSGGWRMASGGWWGFGGGPILFRALGFCVAGFFVQFLIFLLGVEECQDAAEIGSEAGFVAVEAFEGLGLVAADLECCLDFGLLANHFVIHEGGLGGDGAV